MEMQPHHKREVPLIPTEGLGKGFSEEVTLDMGFGGRRAI